MHFIVKIFLTQFLFICVYFLKSYINFQDYNNFLYEILIVFISIIFSHVLFYI
jgi:hypothetical protein